MIASVFVERAHAHGRTARFGGLPLEEPNENGDFHTSHVIRIAELVHALVQLVHYELRIVLELGRASLLPVGLGLVVPTLVVDPQAFGQGRIALATRTRVGTIGRQRFE